MGVHRPKPPKGPRPNPAPRADQRADTTLRVALSDAVSEIPAYSFSEDIIAVTGETHGLIKADVVEAIQGVLAEAAAEPAAAEPPRFGPEGLPRPTIRDRDGCCRFCHSFGSHSRDCDVMLERAAQPPRGSLPDPPDDRDFPITATGVAESMAVPASYRFGGSLTATARPSASGEPPATFTETWRQAYWAHREVPGRHGGECCQDECWPDIGQRVIAAIAPSILQEIDSGSPRGVTLAADRPALDERVLREVMLDSGATMDYANYVAKQYAARLGSGASSLQESPEDSEDG